MTTFLCGHNHACRGDGRAHELAKALASDSPDGPAKALNEVSTKVCCEAHTIDPVPMAPAVALRHIAFEGLGLLAPVLEREGWDVGFCEAAVDDLRHRSIRDTELLIVLGGPIGVYETDDYPFLSAEIALLEYRLSRNLPTVGILVWAAN